MLLLGSSLQLSASVTDANGAPVRGAVVTWQSDAPAVATVSPTGMVMALAPGPATVVASFAGTRASTTLSIREPVPLPAPDGTTPVTTSVLDSAVSLSIPPGAVPPGVSYLTVAPITAPPTDERVLPNTTFAFGPSGTRFTSPITIGIRYDTARVPARDRERLRVFLVSSGIATEVAGSGVPPGALNVVSAVVTHFSDYAGGLRRVAERVRVDSGDGQVAYAGAAVAAGVRVIVTDAAGAPLSRVRVAFRVTSGGGRIEGDSLTSTQADGSARLAGRWILGDLPGTNTLRAEALEGAAPSATVAARAEMRPPPVLQLDPASLAFTGESGGTDPSPQAVTIASASAEALPLTGLRVGTITYGTGASSWLSATITGSRAPFTLTVRASVAALEPGSYTATVPVLSDMPGVVPVAIPVTITVARRTAARLVVVREPRGAQVGVAFAQQPVLEFRDVSDRKVPGLSSVVSVAIASGGGRLLGVTSVTAVDGIATFTDLGIDTPGTFALSFSSAGLPIATSAPFTVTPKGTNGVAARLRITTLADGATSGAPFTTQPIVAITDSGGAVVTTSDTEVSVTVSSGATVLGSTVVRPTGGIATFAGVGLSGLVGRYTLTFAAAGIADASQDVVLEPGVPIRLLLRSMSLGATSGVPFDTPPRVAIADAAGNTVTTGTQNVTVRMESGPGELSGATTIAAVGGIATFPNLALSGLGGHTLRFTSPGLVEALSDPVIVGMAIAVGTRGRDTTSVGRALAVPIIVDLAHRGPDDIASLATTITWDPARFTYVSNASGAWVDATGGAAVVVVNDAEAAAGRLQLAGFTTSATRSTFTIRTITLVAAREGPSVITAAVTSAGAEDGRPITVTPRPLSIMIVR